MKNILSILLFLSVGNVFAIDPIKEYRVDLNQLGLIGRELEIETTDNVLINAWFFPAQKEITQDTFISFYKNPHMRDYQAKENMPTVILCNGDWGNMSFLTNYIFELVSEHYNLLVFDWRGFGKSGDWEIRHENLVLTEFLDDYQSVLNFAMKMKETDKTKIGLFGFSTGAYLSFIMASRNNAVKAMVLRGLVTSFEEVLPVLKHIDPEKELIVPSDFPQHELPLFTAESVNADLYLTVGENDNRTPVEMSEKVFRLYSGKKHLEVVKNAEHGGAKAPEWVYESFFEEIEIFYSSAFQF